MRILVQESPNLALWFKRYGVLKFRGLFYDFFEARDPSEIIFQIPGAFCENYGLWVNYKETQGLLCKNARKYWILAFLIYFTMEKSLDSVHALWTTALGRSMVDPHGRADEKPLKSGWDGTPACWCSLAVAGKGKSCMGDSPRGSPELGEWRSGRATRVKWWRWWGSVGVCSDVGEEERGMVSGAGCSMVEVPFYRGQGRVPGDDNGRHRRRNRRRRKW
jgi:hypothetical protein